MRYAIAGARCCGSTRTKGGLYFEVGLSEYGRPVEDFLIDPPQFIPANLHMSNRGVLTFEREGVLHIADHVGKGFYPNVLDYIQECRFLGVSRKLPPNLPWEKVTSQTRILLAHDYAYVENAQEYAKVAQEQGSEAWRCPKQKHTPEDSPMCVGVYWHDVELGHSIVKADGDPRWVMRELPSFSYEARRRPYGVTPKYRSAFFASFPIGRLAVVKGNGHEEVYNKASRAKVEVDIVDQ